MEILVGCPCYRRDWILPQWFGFVERAFATIDAVPHYVFALNVGDHPTVDMVKAGAAEHGRDLTIAWVDQYTHDDQRMWTNDRYNDMVYYRNTLLEKVRSWKPDFFLSLDSDILLNVRALAGMLEHTHRFDAIGAKAYMQPHGTAAPSYANRLFSGLDRRDSEGTFAAQAIMAIKLMNPLAYGFDYKFHYQGEDFGICETWRENGVRIGWDGRYPSKHVMRREMLDLYDARCGY